MILKIAFKNIITKPLNTFLSVLLLSASIGLISLMIQLKDIVESHFDHSIKDVNLVMGAKGSPLQLILSAVYQMDSPTGNISYETAQQWMKHPFIKKAVPLAYGDNYKGYKIVGSTQDYINLYNAQLKEGQLFEKEYDVVVGSQVAKTLNLKTGSQFEGVHGESAEGEVHHGKPYTVVGVLEPSYTVLDQLIVCSVASVWESHEEHDHEEETHNHSHESHDHAEHDHDDEGYHHHHEEEVKQEKEITAVLLQVKNKMAYISLPRFVSENTDMQIASPAIETNRLFSLLGVGVETIAGIAYGIMLIGGISIFIFLFHMIREKRYEFALLRTLGASRIQLFGMVLVQSVVIAIIGFFVGSVLSRLGLYYLISSEENVKLSVENIYQIRIVEEGVLFISTLAIAILAALLPAIKAYRMSISKTLAHA